MKEQSVIRFIKGVYISGIHHTYYGSSFPCISGSSAIYDRCEELFDVPKLQGLYERVFAPSLVLINISEVYAVEDGRGVVAIQLRVDWEPKACISQLQREQFKAYRAANNPSRDVFSLVSKFEDEAQFLADLVTLRYKVETVLYMHKNGRSVTDIVLPDFLFKESLARETLIRDIKIPIEKL